MYYALFNEQCNSSEPKQQFMVDSNGIITNKLIGNSQCVTSTNRQNIFGSDSLRVLKCNGNNDESQQWNFMENWVD